MLAVVRYTKSRKVRDIRIIIAYSITHEGGSVDETAFVCIGSCCINKA